MSRGCCRLVSQLIANSLLYGLQGDQPHCGFPEATYHTYAERLARNGFRVVVVEQTETPEQLRIRNEGRPQGQAKVQPGCKLTCTVLSS